MDEKSDRTRKGNGYNLMNAAISATIALERMKAHEPADTIPLSELASELRSYAHVPDDTHKLSLAQYGALEPLLHLTNDTEGVDSAAGLAGYIARMADLLERGDPLKRSDEIDRLISFCLSLHRALRSKIDAEREARHSGGRDFDFAPGHTYRFS